eukprot:gb/GECG01015884.1/.p1 GENE.gb/GECG01015884.1/~~gb/GECG01015884.1/.p1  ORF type:complete len:286 (+),score=36.28 gb/GECG01015884.1/:1-858(+)
MASQATSSLSFIDAGVNLCAKQFKQGQSGLIKRAQDANVRGLITISNGYKDWKPNLGHCRRFSKLEGTPGEFQVKTTIGIHPHDAKSMFKEGTSLDSTMAELEQLLEDDATRGDIVAVGECGLDYDRMFSPAEQQREVFRRQIVVAARHNKPVYLHERKAHEDFWTIMKEARENYPSLQGIVHCFTGDEETMHKYLSLGLYVGITGWICDSRRNRHLLKAVKTLPMERLVLETDSPFLAPPEIKQRKNEPFSLPYICAKVAEVKGVDTDTIMQHARTNAKDLFGL